MRTFTVTLKGTKKNNTPNLTVKVLADNKAQAFGFAYDFFEKGRTKEWTDYKGVKHTIQEYIPTAAEHAAYAGKYKVAFTSVRCN